MNTVVDGASDAASRLVTNEEMEASLSALLDGVREEIVSDEATLADMLAEGVEVKRRGQVFIAIPPSLRVLERIGELMAKSAKLAEESLNGSDTIRSEAEIGTLLLWKREEDGLRPAHVSEIREAFSRVKLTRLIFDTLAENGMGEKKGADGQ